MLRIFVSYSHRDEAWMERVVQHLRVLAPQGLDVWVDTRIGGGDDWQPAIEQAIAACDVAVLLISSHFLTSEFILDSEVPPLLQRRQEQGVRVMPLIVSPCAWTRIAWLKPIQARPKNGQPLTGMSTHDADVALTALVEEIAAFGDAQSQVAPGGGPLPPDKIDLTHLPAGAPHFLGRDKELAALDAAWNSAGKTAIAELIAPGGTGKTALAKRWTEALKTAGWRGARRVFAWSFYSQSTDDKRQASEDHFLDQAIRWFGVDIAASANPADKGRALGEAVAACRTLLVLDGLEPLQYPPGPLAGELRAPGVQALLTHLATAGHPGLCLVTSREWLKNLDEWVRGDDHPQGVVLRIDLGNLTDVDGAKLLHAEGTTRAGGAAIAADDAELVAASREVQGHALTLTLLGRYLALAYGGNILQRTEVKFEEADAEATGGHAFRVIAAYENWFVREGDKGARQLAALRLLGFFDRPASRKSLRALRSPPAIPGLTRPLVTLKPELWTAVLKQLERCGLVQFDEASGSLDAHPLVREYFAAGLEKNQPDAWRKGHCRLYEQLKDSAPHHPMGLTGLQPLYQAVLHGCKAGLYEEALYDLYVDRILRGADGYSAKKLGAIGANLGAVACFFVEPWRRLAPALTEADQAWLLNEAAFCLRAMGRLAEALEPMRAGAKMAVRQEDWKNAAIGYSGLSELLLSLGRIAAVVADAELAVVYADMSGDAFQRIVNRTTRADACHQQGQVATALADFAAAQAMQAERQPECPLLYSLPGFRYCDLLLAIAERTAWREEPDAVLAATCDEVTQLVAQTLAWEECMPGAPLLDFALHHLTLARCALYADHLRGSRTTDTAQAEAAVASLRQAGRSDYLPHGLLTRAWLRHCGGDAAGAAADLDEAHRIAARGGMKLHLADIALTRARLFRKRAELAKARELIEECGYGRRIPELEDAEARAEEEGW